MKKELRLSESKENMEKIRRKRIRKIILLCGILCLIYVLYVAIGIWRYAQVDEKSQADVAIVLGAGTSGGEVSPVFRERLNHGI